jgi:hypothetical protein
MNDSIARVRADGVKGEGGNNQNDRRKKGGSERNLLFGVGEEHRMGFLRDDAISLVFGAAAEAYSKSWKLGPESRAFVERWATRQGPRDTKSPNSGYETTPN